MFMGFKSKQIKHLPTARQVEVSVWLIMIAIWRQHEWVSCCWTKPLLSLNKWMAFTRHGDGVLVIYIRFHLPYISTHTCSMYHTERLAPIRWLCCFNLMRYIWLMLKGICDTTFRNCNTDWRLILFLQMTRNITTILVRNTKLSGAQIRVQTYIKRFR